MLILREVNEGLDLSTSEQQLLTPAVIGLPKNTRGAPNSGSSLMLGLGRQRVAQRLHLGEV
ncbi:d907b334-cee1-417b-925e-7359c5931177 [Thermothielavioides terrestris]|uniref:D907b334-cee1-417b-925e-7359c5931177 n=1 Tax=Thermothielavioides terrestris TaxID=2587410 RepID=A0A3S5CWJ5_9PEZI|nr:d907b334-cee1-417b-925e-7359c5931177 [Thermothielavioides terrestris]